MKSYFNYFFVLLLWVYKNIILLLFGYLLCLICGVELIVIILLNLVIIAFYVVFERKLLAAIQRRRGPNIIGFWGLLQSIADGLKLMLKEVLIPYKANYNIFVLAPIISFTITLLILSSLPVSSVSFFNVLNTDIDILIYFALSSLSVYGVLLSGWSSNSKYAFLGGLRSAAQMISYEIFFSLVLLIIIFMSKSANILDIVNKQQIVWYIVPCFPIAIIFFIALLAETNRTPFDLPEAEAEIIAGYNIEYSSMLFALFFLSEYGNMFALSYLFTLFFLGGWLGPFNCTLPFGFWAIAKTIIIATNFIIIRANIPRYRYDQLMALGWKIFLPFVFSWFLFVISLLI